MFLLCLHYYTSNKSPFSAVKFLMCSMTISRPKLKVPTIYKALNLGLNFRGYTHNFYGQKYDTNLPPKSDFPMLGGTQSWWSGARSRARIGSTARAALGTHQIFTTMQAIWLIWGEYATKTGLIGGFYGWLANCGKWSLLIGKSTINEPFSIAMLDYQRVTMVDWREYGLNWLAGSTSQQSSTVCTYSNVAGL